MPEQFTWAVISGEYPPQAGGVADYTHKLAQALAASGDEVHVFAPPVRGPNPDVPFPVHRLVDRFGARGLGQLHVTLQQLPRPRIALVQFVPQSFGVHGGNLPFGLWLRWLKGYPLWIMFHEYAITDDPGLSAARRAQAAGTRLVAWLAARAADLAFVSTPAWTPRVRAAAGDVQVHWLPVCSNISTGTDKSRVRRLSSEFRTGGVTGIFAHFGTYRMVDTCASLRVIIPALLQDTARRFILLGRGSNEFANSIIEQAPHLGDRVLGCGALPPDVLADHLAAVDVLVQPFGEGVTARRGSVLAGLGLGVPTVTTDGSMTESFWHSSRALIMVPAGDDAALVKAATALIQDTDKLRSVSIEARMTYSRYFAISRTVEALRCHASAAVMKVHS